MAALFTIAKTWKKPKCPLKDEWIRKMWYIYTRNVIQPLKGKKSNDICSNTDAPRNYAQ